MAHFGAKITEWRNRHGWSQVGLAERAIKPSGEPLNRQTVIRAESVKRATDVQAQTITALAHAFKVSPQQFTLAVEEDWADPTIDPLPFGSRGHTPTLQREPNSKETFTDSRRPNVGGTGRRVVRPRPIPLHGMAPATMGNTSIGVEVEAVGENDARRVDMYLPGELFPQDPAAGATWVSGDSMAPQYLPGDIVVYAPSLQSQVRDGDVCCIQLRQEAGGGCTLKQISFLPDGKHVQLTPFNRESPQRIVRKSMIEQCYPVVVHIRPLHSRRSIPFDYSVEPAEDQLRCPTLTAGEAPSPGEEGQAFPDYDHA